MSANVAYYPYDSKVTVCENTGTYTLNATFPVTQTYSRSGTFGNGTSPMVAVTSSLLDANLKFKNVGAIFRLVLKGEATITKIVFSADAELAGNCEIIASNTSVPSVEVTEGYSYVILDCGEGVALNAETATNFIVAMLPVADVEGGITITIYDNAGKKMVYKHKENETITIERSKAYTTAEVTYSGNEDANEAESVQSQLDAATGNATIQLQPGVDYGTLYLRQNSGSKVVDITDIGGDASGNEIYSRYENITIIGAPGATVDQIAFQTGRLEDPIWSYVDVKNLTIKDVTFTGNKTALNLDSSGAFLGIDGLNILGCTMNDADGADRFVYQPKVGYKTLTDKLKSEPVMITGVKNLTISGCEITGAYQVIEARPMENITITDNTFTNIKARDILLAGSEPYTGTITITGNTSDGSTERFIRASSMGDATLVINNNTIRNYKGADPDYIKIEGHTGTLDSENNTFEVATPAEMSSAFGPAIEGINVLLTQDVVLTDALTVANGQIFVLDMNGKTLSQTKVQTTAYAMIANKGTLVIRDSKGSGKITYIDGGNGGEYASNTISNYGTLTIESGVIENLSSETVKNNGYPHAIDVYQGSVTNITGGTVKSANYDCIRMFCNSTTLPTEVNISGGKIINRVTFQNPGSSTAGYGRLNITGGEFTTTGSINANVRLLNFSTDVSNMKAVISDGIFDKGVGISNYCASWVPDWSWLESNVPYVVTDAAQLQAALDYATDGTTINLVDGKKYDVVYMGRPTKSNNTKMSCTNDSFITTDADEFKNHLSDGAWHPTPIYVTTLKNLTINGAAGAEIAGLIATSGHAYGDVYDYVLDKQTSSGSAYYNTLNISNVTFSNVCFTGKIDINTSDADSVYDGIIFDGCTFTTGGTESSNGAALRYYNESNNGNVKNIKVNECTFINSYQGVYVHHVNGITVNNSKFNGTGHNAIAIQSHDGSVDLKNVVVTGNTFTNIKDRIIRFGEVGSDSNITIKNNSATSSGDEDKQVMKATSIASGVKTDISGNNWGDGIVVNEELQDK